MRYVFHPEARLEYLEAVVFYEERQAGLGARFTLDVEAAIQRIVEGPHRWRVLEEEVRRCLARTFPYGVLYTIEADHVLILAVMHHSREPGYWRNRASPNPG